MAWEPVATLSDISEIKSTVLAKDTFYDGNHLLSNIRSAQGFFLFQTPKSSSSWDFGELNGKRNWFREFEFLFPTSCFAIKIQGLNDGDNDGRRGRKCVGLKKIFVAFTCQSFMEDWFRVIFANFRNRDGKTF